jgi:hypothetical protein
VKKVCTITPYYRNSLTEDEKVSLRVLKKYLGHVDNILIVPEKIRATHPDFEVIRLPDECFKSIHSYNDLLLSRKFYELFRDYKYILVYQLDCLVFSSNLEEWCDRGYDYVGAPWIQDPEKNWMLEPRADDPSIDWESLDIPDEKFFYGVGNGGLSLRRVQWHLDVLNSRRGYETPLAYWRRTSSSFASGLVQVGKALVKASGLWNDVNWFIRKNDINEDFFWSRDAPRFVNETRIPEARDALDFAIEMEPRECYRRNGERLPFGCHGWHRYDRAFWSAFLA